MLAAMTLHGVKETKKKKTLFRRREVEKIDSVIPLRTEKCHKDSRMLNRIETKLLGELLEKQSILVLRYPIKI